MVRFGNVLSSSGSAVPLFTKQIASGGPVTLTHPKITRYFMTIKEASQLVIQSAMLSKGGDVFLLDMGVPKKIIDLAREMIWLSGLREKNKENPDGDIEIIYTGLRPGEKLYEELLIDSNSMPTNHPLIYKALEKKFDGLKTNNIKILYDMGGIYKSFEKYDEAIKIYSKLLDMLDKRSKAYADILYRRGGSFERIGDYETADKDLLESLNITRENPYVLNYLAYSWLERNYKIELSMEMLKEAYDLRKNDPYITDSLGWGYYLINDFENAEKYLKKAVELMPYDPIVNDHYGDILWMLNRKIQARYFWNNVLNLEETDDEMKIDVKKKIIYGIEKT